MLIIGEVREKLKISYYQGDRSEYILHFRKLVCQIPQEKNYLSLKEIIWSRISSPHQCDKTSIQLISKRNKTWNYPMPLPERLIETADLLMEIRKVSLVEYPPLENVTTIITHIIDLQSTLENP